MKSDLAVKRDEWFDSEEGRVCAETDILAIHPAHGKHLKARLERAFLAGARASDEIEEILQHKSARL